AGLLYDDAGGRSCRRGACWGCSPSGRRPAGGRHGWGAGRGGGGAGGGASPPAAAAARAGAPPPARPPAAPPGPAADFAAVARGRFGLARQGPGDLGRRLERFVAGALAGGARAVVVVGTDSPTLPVEWVERAFTELERADVVLGPAADGGYYLLG